VTDARGQALVETCIALALFVAAAVWGTWYWNRSLEAGHPPFFYQSYFEPAVMVACGQGFVVARPQIAAMTGFLSQQTDRFVCGAIPPDAKLGTEDLYQGPWRYLMVTVGVAWRVLGISWSGMGPLFGLLFAATIVAAYGIFRLGMGRSLALLCACGLCLSPLHLLNLPHLRDYAKAPFTLLLILLLGLLVTRRPAWRNVLAIAAGYGVVLGIGYGFRTDFLANIPAFFLVLFVFLEGGPLRNLGLKGAAAAVCASAFLLTAWPIISVVYRSGGCQWHTVLLGLSPDYSDALGLDQPAYEWTTTATDEFVYATVTSYARRTQPGVGHIAYCQHEYDVATGRYLTDIVRHFPADMLIRGYASALHIVQLPFGWRKPPLPNTAKALYAIRRTILEWTRGSGLILVALAIGLTMVDNVRLGLFLVFFVLYFGSYPALQFANRHFFHLEFVTWWAAGFLIHLALTKGPLLIRGGARDGRARGRGLCARRDALDVARLSGAHAAATVASLRRRGEGRALLAAGAAGRVRSDRVGRRRDRSRDSRTAGSQSQSPALWRHGQRHVPLRQGVAPRLLANLHASGSRGERRADPNHRPRVPRLSGPRASGRGAWVHRRRISRSPSRPVSIDAHRHSAAELGTRAPVPALSRLDSGAGELIAIEHVRD
jgi:hypothetical protein